MTGQSAIENQKVGYVEIEISEGDIREGLTEEFGRDPTAAEVKDFETYLERDVGTWLNENFRSYTRKLSEEGKLK